VKPRIQITGGRLIDPANEIDQNSSVYIAEGRVVALGQAPDGFTADLTIDAADRWIIPGLIDLRVALREPGAEHKSTIASELAAAAAGGITSLCATPDTTPVADSPVVIEFLHQRASAPGPRLYPIGAATRDLAGEELAEMASLAAAGCIGFAESDRATANTLVRWRMMQYAASHNLLLLLQPWDNTLAAAGCLHDGTVSARLGLPGIPTEAEVIGLQRDLALARRSGARIHFCGLSSAAGAAIIRNEIAHNNLITADVSAHQLHLTDEACLDFDPHYRLQPPLRTSADRTALRQALADGTLAAICSDHQPHEADAKLQPFAQAAPGISALETLLPLVLSLTSDGLSVATAVAAVTAGPARVLGIDAGQLGLNAAADICIVDPAMSWTPAKDGWLSRGQNSPFFNQPLSGRATHTLVAGEPVFELQHHG